MSDRLIDMKRIAALFGVEYETVQKWRTRDLGFPKPMTVFGRTPVWKESRIRAWGVSTGRLSE